MRKNHKNDIGFFVTLGFIVLVFSIGFMLSNPQPSKAKDNNVSYSIEVLKEDGNWLYKIFKNDILYIKQDYLPAVHGKQRFASQKDAKQVAQLVVQKLQRQKIPLITKEELITNKIAFQPL